MHSNYAEIVKQNIETLFSDDLPSRAAAMAAQLEGQQLIFPAFGSQCRISADGVWLDNKSQTGPKGIILSLYALHAISEECRLEPFKAFKELPNSAPYAGAFASHTEQPLTALVDRILDHRQALMDHFGGQPAPENLSGDGAIIVHPLPKIALCYIFYAADEDFLASATCLLSNNCVAFLPLDGLADTGEYTSRAIIDQLELIAPSD
jgi:hypothetical protein